jgi:chaperonin GroEL (HSP60 family)
MANLFNQGVLDPVLVTKSAISYGASVIGLAIACKAIILDGLLDDKKGMVQ